MNTTINQDNDIDHYGNGIGAELGCLACRETHRTRHSLTPTYMLACLCCGECGEPLVEYEI